MGQEQAIIISDSPEKPRTRRPPAIYIHTSKCHCHMFFSLEARKKYFRHAPLTDPKAPSSVDDVDAMEKWLVVGLKRGHKKINIKIKCNDFEELCLCLGTSER